MAQTKRMPSRTFSGLKFRKNKPARSRTRGDEEKRKREGERERERKRGGRGKEKIRPIKGWTHTSLIIH